MTGVTSDVGVPSTHLVLFLDLRYFAHGIVPENKEIADMCNGRDQSVHVPSQ